MTRNLNGIGTTYYGRCRFRADGSFETTAWIVLIWVPIFPLRTVRAMRIPSADQTNGITSITGLHEIERVSLNFMQIFRTYCAFLLCIFWLLIVGALILAIPTGDSSWVLAIKLTIIPFTLVIPQYFIYLWRRQAEAKSTGRTVPRSFLSEE